ncbi:MAG: helix-turn-helix domain-containing protein [Candidatus Izemoplasmataceae bacterium]
MENKNVGKILKALRQKKGLTQKEIADSLIITPQTISKWENGLSQPSLEMLMALSELYEVSVDDLLKGQAGNDVTVKPHQTKNKFKTALYATLLGMSLLGVLTLFVDFALLWITVIELDESTSMYVFPAIFEVDNAIDPIMAAVMIVSPLLIAYLSFLDQKKYYALALSNLVLIYFVLTLGRYMGHPSFHEPLLGLFITYIFIILLVITIGLNLLIAENDLFKRLTHHKNYLIMGISSYIIAFVLPFTYAYVMYYDDFIDAFTYYETLDQSVVGLMMVLGSLVLLKPIESLKKIVTVFSLLMIILLLVTILIYIFNSGLIMPSFFMYIYILLLALTIKKDEFTLLSMKNFPLNIITIIEIIAVIVYLYLLTLDGDLFFGLNPETGYSESIRNSNLPYGSLIALHLILLIIPIFFRFIDLPKTAILFYGIWFIFEGWFLYDLTNRYIVSGYQITDGILYFIPPFLLLSYANFSLGGIIVKRLTKRSLVPSNS